ncbi:IS110 family transposase [Aeromicrobium choanae]|uniref:IS110 family transposase n=1 Tax=Aeromicrobium choanae TaxID=1736691 RepID=UPI0018D3A16A|nr:transposase [Aeromicrobium choanae]
MLSYAKSWPDRVWAVEGSNGAGRPLAQRLLENGEQVVDVPAKLAARVRLFDTGHNRKTDAHDAHAVAVVAVRTSTLRVLQLDGELEALRMLTDRRETLTRRRIQTVDRLQALLAELLPGQAKRDITTGQAKPCSRQFGPVTSPGRPAGGSPPRNLPNWSGSKPRSKGHRRTQSHRRGPRLARDGHPRSRPGRRSADPG